MDFNNSLLSAGEMSTLGGGSGCLKQRAVGFRFYHYGVVGFWLHLGLGFWFYLGLQRSNLKVSYYNYPKP